MFATTMAPINALAASNPNAALRLWYDKPAVKWEPEALPIGNGRLGAMIFGGIKREHIQFNEDSLWIGDENDTGAYQAFGDLLVTFGDGDRSVTNPSNHASPGTQTIQESIDGKPGTKWCTEHGGRFPIIWQMAMPPKSPAVTSYTITSATELPERDPKAWRFLGSQDGVAWTVLDEQKDVPVWPARQSPKTFPVTNQTAYAHYRLEFLETHKAPHFQVAEIALGPIPLALGARQDPHMGTPTAYRRELDISRAVHTVTYSIGGVQFRREYFASHPAKVMVFRYTADKPGALTGTLMLTDAHKGNITAEGNRLTAKGNLAGYTHSLSGKNAKYNISLDYESQLLAINEGGKVEAKDGKLVFTGVNTLTVFLDAGTDFVQDRSKGWRGAHPHDAITARLAEAMATPYDKLLAAHVKDYQKLFNRLTLDLGASGTGILPVNSGPGQQPATGKMPVPLNDRPTDQRLVTYRQANTYSKHPTVSPDPELETLLFQYARYLMISSSRQGDLPANLQGVWNNSNQPPWRCDYHSDINVQMNYWFVDMANLPGCFQPYSEWLWSVIPVRRDATKNQFKTRGWATRSENGIFGGATYHWVPGDAAWLAQNIWDHYAFTQDKKYLETRAYPIIKELCEFWEDFLKERPDGKLVSPKSQSPEHGPWAEGNSYEQQLVYDLFTNYIEASKALGVDEDYRKKVESMRSRLLGPQIGKWGQLQEWAQDLDNPKDQHRHTSHLLAVFPGRQITPAATPELAKAAAISLAARGETGDSRTGWAWVFRSAIWARLAEAEKAYHCLTGIYKFHLLPNLFQSCPPFQIDSSFGYATMVGEMLIQSHEQDAEGLQIIRLLPALPKVWSNGSVKGICARGGFTVDMTWKDGKVTDYRITSSQPREVKVRVNGELKTIRSEGI
jgi:alpha-L-fucosidase 2